MRTARRMAYERLWYEYRAPARMARCIVWAIALECVAWAVVWACVYNARWTR